MLTRTLHLVTDGRVLLERDDERGIARITLANPERKNAYDPAMRAAARRLPRRARVRRRHQGRAAPRRGWGVQHRRRHGQRLQLVRRRRVEGSEATAEPAPPPAHRPQDVRLLPVLPRLPEGHRRRGVRLRARWRLRAGPDGRHRRRGQRHGDRDARHPLPRPGPGVAPPVLPPPRPGARPAPAAHRRHHQGRRGRPPRHLHRGRRPRAPSRPAPPGSPRRCRACRPTAS